MRSATALDLLEDVRGDHDRSSLAGELPHDRLEVQPLAGVGTRERLIEQHHLGVVHDRGGETHPLAHPARVAADRAILRLRHIDDLDRAGGRRGDIVDSVEPGVQLDELSPREEWVDRFMLRHHAETAVDRGIAAHALVEHRDVAIGGSHQPGRRVHQRGLAGAVGAKQPRDAAEDIDRDLVDGNDAAEPLRDAVESRWSREVPRRRSRRQPAQLAAARRSPRGHRRSVR